MLIYALDVSHGKVECTQLYNIKYYDVQANNKLEQLDY